MNVPLPCPLYVSCGAEDPRCIKKSVQAWQECVSGAENTCQVKYFSGGHHYLLNEEESKNAFLNYLSEDVLNRILENKKDILDDVLVPGTSSGSGGVEEAPILHQTIGNGGAAGVGGGGPGSIRSMSSDAGATVASGSSYAAIGAGGTTRQQRSGIGGAMNGSVGRFKGSLVDDGRSDRDDLDDTGQGDDGGACGTWKMTCCCF